MKFNTRLICIIACCIGFTSCCHYETVKCHDGGLPVIFRGFDKSELSTIQVNYLKKASASRIVLSGYQIDSSQIYTYGTNQYGGTIMGTDTADIEVYLPHLSRTYLITAIEQKGKRETEEMKVCKGFFDKISLECSNLVTSYALDGVAGTVDSTGARILFQK